MIALLTVLLTITSQISAQYGAYNPITDTDELSAVSDLCDSIKSDIIDLVNDNDCTNCDQSCSLRVLSASNQVVAGTNYRVQIAICDYSQQFNIQFHVPLPVNGTQQLPQDLTLFTPTTTTVDPTNIVGGFTQMTDADDLAMVNDLCTSMKPDIFQLLTDNGCTNCNEDCSFSIISAERQIVAGTNYRVEMSVCDDAQVFNIQFYVPLPVNGTAQAPQNLAILTASNIVGGYNQITDNDELNEVEYICNDIRSDIISLVNTHFGEEYEDSCYIQLVSAQRQIVAGTNYRADIRICDPSGQIYSVQFFVPLPVNGTAQNPQDLHLLTTTTFQPMVPGGFSKITEDEGIRHVEVLCNELKSDILDLVSANEECSISVINAYSQVVAGINYKVDIKVCEKAYTIQFYQPLPVNGVEQTPQDLRLLSISYDTTTKDPYSMVIPGGWSQVTDAEGLSAVKDFCEVIKSDIIDLVNDNGCQNCDISCSLSVEQAYSQVVAGTNYKAQIGVCDGENKQLFNIQFYVPLPEQDGTVHEPEKLIILDQITTTAEPNVNNGTDEESKGAVDVKIAIIVSCAIVAVLGVTAFIYFMRKRNKQTGDGNNGYKGLLNQETSHVDEEI